MNKNIFIGIAAALVLLAIGGFFLFHKQAAAPAPTRGTTTLNLPGIGTTTVATQTTGSSTGKAASVTVLDTKPLAGHKAALDQASLASNTGHVVLSGTANVSAVAIVLDNPQGVGIIGSSHITVANGRWSYAVPLKLSPGTYTIHLLGGDKQVDAKLVVAY